MATINNREVMDDIDFLQLIDGKVPVECERIFKEYTSLFLKAPGSAKKHQVWEGGYLDHVAETFKIAEMMYFVFNLHRKLPFTLESVYKVLYLHDIEKPFKYSATAAITREAAKRPDFKWDLIKDYKIELTPEEENAIKYIHGENEDYGPERVMNELAAFCHCCDILSARMWWDFPKSK